MLEGFFQPQSVAVVGVAREPGKVGHFVFSNIIDGGFVGELWPINPNASEILGRKCYPSVRALPGVPDLVVIAVPAELVCEVIEQCGERGVGAAVVLSAGFKETGPEGARLEHEIARLAHAGGVRLLGPNSLGLVASGSKLNAAFAGAIPRPGGLAFLSQSGALGTAVLDEAAGEGAGLAYFVSLGNRADVDESDLLDAWAVDPDVRVAAGYLESIRGGRKFISAARGFSAVKPLVILKAGTSDAGARAVSSHTGSLAGSDAAYDAALAAGGALRAKTTDELFDAALAFELQSVPEGPGVAILTNAGGLGVLATDAADRAGLWLASLEAETIESLREVLPPSAALYNPVDVIGDAGPQRYAAAARALIDDPGVHSLLVMLTPQATSDPTQTAHALLRECGECTTTIVACFAGAAAVAESRSVLRAGGVPCYESPERAIGALAMMDAHRRQLEASQEPPVRPEIDAGTCLRPLQRTRGSGLVYLTDEDAAQVAKGYGIPVPPGGLAADLAEARDVADLVGYPLALKVSSPDILHKSDVGGVITGVTDDAALDAAYEALLERVRRRAPDAAIRGVYVQRMAAPGRELIIGVDRDATFGPLLMVGLGGVYVEVLHDVTFNLCPVSKRQALAMLARLKGFSLLKGVRGEQAADTDAVADIISRVSWLAADFEDIVELDINPVIVGDKGQGATAADVRIGIGG